MHRTKYRPSNKLSMLINTAFSSLIGFIVIFIIVLFFAFIITKIDVTDKIVSLMSGAALCIGAYAGGYISAKKRRKNGLLMGVLCGVFMFLVILIIGSVFIRAVSGTSPNVKLILTLICAGTGGIVGVNSKSRRF